MLSTIMAFIDSFIDGVLYGLDVLGRTIITVLIDPSYQLLLFWSLFQVAITIILIYTLCPDSVRYPLFEIL